MSRKHISKPSFLISIIIPSYQRFDLLQKCLNAIPAAFEDISYEVIIIDNASPQEEKGKFLAHAVFPPNTHLVHLSQNVGFPKACNRGASMAKGALLFFLNNDVILSPGSGVKMIQDLDDPEVGVVGMKLVFPDEEELQKAQLKHSAVQRSPGRIQHVGLFTNLRGQVIHMYLGWSADNPRVNAIREVFAVTGAALMTRRMLFREVNGFDNAFGMGTYEDVDFCFKVREKGLKVLVEIQAVGKHYAGATAEQYNLAFPLNQNKVIYEQKWYNKLVWDEWTAW